MLSRNDQPNINNFNYGIDSVFNNIAEYPNAGLAPMHNNLLFLDGEKWLLLEGTNFVLL